MAEPFLNWLVDIMLESSPSWRPIFAVVPHGVRRMAQGPPCAIPALVSTSAFQLVSFLLAGLLMAPRRRRAIIAQFFRLSAVKGAISFQLFGCSL